MTSILEGIVIGGAGGAVAGITVYTVQYLHTKLVDRRETSKVENWIKANTRDKIGEKFRSTRAIASWTNLPEDRVRYLCSHSEAIYLSTGEKEDMWGTLQREPDIPKPDEVDAK